MSHRKNFKFLEDLQKKLDGKAADSVAAVLDGYRSLFTRQLEPAWLSKGRRCCLTLRSGSEIEGTVEQVGTYTILVNTGLGGRLVYKASIEWAERIE